MATQLRASSASGEFRLEALRVLLAEDNAVNQVFTSRLLTKRGCSVTVVADGRAALRALAEGAFDVVLMDVQMPEMSGLDAAATIRAGEVGTGRRVPIVALTAHAMKSDREACIAAGMDEYLSKPVRGADLFEAIDRVAGASKLARGAAAGPVGDGGAIDRAALIDDAGGDMDLVREMIAVFMSEADGMVAAVRGAVEARASEPLFVAAHRLRGALGHFRAKRAQAVAADLEAMGRAQSLDRASDALARLEGEVRGVEAALGRLTVEAAPSSRAA